LKTASEKVYLNIHVSIRAASALAFTVLPLYTHYFWTTCSRFMAERTGCALSDNEHK